MKKIIKVNNEIECCDVCEKDIEATQFEYPHYKRCVKLFTVEHKDSYRDYHRHIFCVDCARLLENELDLVIKDLRERGH